jgi:SAM-dependent methyltransferase
MLIGTPRGSYAQLFEGQKKMLGSYILNYFKRGEVENQKFFERLGGTPDFTSLTVLDVGCGLGRLCVDVALQGARKVVGLDINPLAIEFANEIILRDYPELQKVISFHCQDLADYPEEMFDVILCKDSLEHIIDVELLLSQVKQRLNIGGKIYIGFGPLYNSYYGDHRRTNAIIPWGHLIFPENFLLKRLNQKRQDKASSICELGLNKLPYADYERILFNADLQVDSMQINVSDHPILKMFTCSER